MKVTINIKHLQYLHHNISEEILGQSEALWVSPDGSRLAYIKFNDSLVDLVTLREYGSPKESGAPIRKVNTREKKFRYPKVCCY